MIAIIKSFIKMINNNGLRTDPWSTPLRVAKTVAAGLLIFDLRSVYKLKSSLIKTRGNLNCLWSLKNSASLQTESYAFEMSRKARNRGQFWFEACSEINRIIPSW